MKRKILSLLLALCLVVGMVPLAASAAGATVTSVSELKDAVAQGGEIVLGGNLELTETLNVSNNVVIDLHGNTIQRSSDFSASPMICVNEGGDLTVQDTVSNGQIISSTGIAIENHGTFTLRSGTIDANNSSNAYGIRNRVTSESFGKNQAVICNIEGGTISSDVWGVAFFGAGIAGQEDRGTQSINTGETGSVNNSLMQVNISGDAEISGLQAVTTAANNGIYAGYTLNISDNAKIIGTNGVDGCAMYLPGYGITNISGGTISGGQGIRIASGDLTITDGQITGTTLSNGKDLVAGGSTGTQGAIVAGKAGGGYVGNLKISVSGNAVISNSAQGDGTKPAIVVSDKNMSDDGKGYDDLSISVIVNGATVQGDVIQISNLTDTSTSDGGNTSLVISNRTNVTGNITNQSKTNLSITDSTVTGSVSKISDGNVSISNSSVGFISSDQENTSAGTITIDDVTFTNPDSNTFEAAVNGKTYETFEAAIDAANQESAVPVVVELLKDVTLDVPEGIGAGQGAVNLQKNMTIEGNDHTITAGRGYIGASNGYHMINIDSGANVIIENLKVDGDHASESSTKPRSGINVYTARATTSPTNVTLNNVTVTNCSTYGVTSNGSIVTATNLNTSGNGWGGVNVDNMNGAALGGSLTINSGTIQSVVIENTSCASDGQNVTIEGGTFTGDVKLQNSAGNTVSTLDGVALKVSGGTFSNQATRDYLEKNGFLAEGMEFDSNGKVVEEQPSTPVTPSTPTYANTVSDTENGKVTASPTRPKEGATVTITTTPDKGYEVGSVSVTDADGKAVAVTNAGNGKYTFKQPDSKVTIKVTFVWDNPFTDVGNAWYRNAIQYVYENNLMAGTGDTTFDPEVSLTRAMTAQILYNLEGKPKVDEEATFADMNEAPTWSVDAIAWAQDTGVVAGMGDNQFAPNLKVTREQFAQMMYNYAKYKKYDLTKTGDLSKFPDDGSVSDWAETAMSWANGNGLINGHEDSGLIDPAGNTIRGQAASIIMNFDKNVVK